LYPAIILKSQLLSLWRTEGFSKFLETEIHTPGKEL